MSPARSSRIRDPFGKTEIQPSRASPARIGNARACGSAGVASGTASSPSASFGNRSRTEGGVARSPVPATARCRHCASSTSTAASIAAARCAARACAPPPLAATRASASAYASSVSDRSRRSGRAGAMFSSCTSPASVSAAADLSCGRKAGGRGTRWPFAQRPAAARRHPSCRTAGLWPARVRSGHPLEPPSCEAQEPGCKRPTRALRAARRRLHRRKESLMTTSVSAPTARRAPFCACASR